MSVESEPHTCTLPDGRMLAWYASDCAYTHAYNGTRTNPPEPAEFQLAGAYWLRRGGLLVTLTQAELTELHDCEAAYAVLLERVEEIAAKHAEDS